jgi:SHS2 domain-containing protein
LHDTEPQFELVEHTADIGFRAYGSSREELFANCARALISIMFDVTDVNEKRSWHLSAEGEDQESLLVNWLNEVLFFLDTRRLVFGRLQVAFPATFRIECTAWGEERDPQRHPGRLQVKAATYHQLRIVKEGDVWMAEVYVDV